MAIRFPKDIFHSARLQLTLFYLAVLVVFSLVLTVGTRDLAFNAYHNSDLAQRGEFRHIMDDFPFNNDPSPMTFPNSGIDNFQDEQEAQVRQQLNIDLVVTNLVALVVGGAVSYWFAGRALKPIAESHEAQKRFASDASHELRTPLTNMRVENEVFLRQKEFTPKEARELIESNLEEVQRLESLAGNLLSLSQYENVTLPISNVVVKHLVESALSGVGKVAEAKNIEFVTDVEPATVRGHHESLVQLLCIILDNAVKYGPKKSKVFINGAAKGSDYVIRIRDQGPGIDEADLSHIFERLYRGDKARTSHIGGYGLGLSLAKEIAEANHAAVYGENYPEGGAQFVISLDKA